MRLYEFIRAEPTLARTLYVCRTLRNADELVAWARSQGLSSTLPLHDMHVTVAYSKEKVRWCDTAPSLDTIRAQGGDRRVAFLGTKGALVLHFECEELKSRWADLVNDVGCSWDYDGYRPHVTITYQAPSIDVRQIKPFTGSLVFGPERFAEIDDNFVAKLKECPVSKA